MENKILRDVPDVPAHPPLSIKDKGVEYSQDYFENLPPSHIPNKTNQLSTSTNLKCPKPGRLNPSRKDNFKPHLKYDSRHLRGGFLNPYSDAWTRNSSAEIADELCSSSDEDEFMNMFNGNVDTDYIMVREESPENTTLPLDYSEPYYRLGSSTSTHISRLDEFRSYYQDKDVEKVPIDCYDGKNRTKSAWLKRNLATLQSMEFVSSPRTNTKTILRHETTRDRSADSSQSNEENTAVESVDTDGKRTTMPLERHRSKSTNSISSSLSSELNWVEEMKNKECLTEFDSSITSLTPHKANKPNRFPMSTNLTYPKPDGLYPWRKANSEPDLRKNFVDKMEFRESYYHSGSSVLKFPDEPVYSSFDYSSGEDDTKTINIPSNILLMETPVQLKNVMDQRASPENTPLPSELSGQFLSSSGSSTSTHIRIGDTSHLDIDELEESYQEEEEDDDDERNGAEGGIRSYNNFKTMRSKKQNTVTAIKNDLSESVKTVMDKSLSLDKVSNQRDQNDFRSYYQDVGTQTKSQNLPRTIFNTGWTAEASFDFRGGELQTENSSVKLIVNPDTVAESESITINAHVHVNIKKLAEVLEIPLDEFIVSPAPEYHLNADWKKVIKKQMIIQLPIVLPPTFITENLRVYVFQSNAGQVGKYSIGEKSKQNDNDEDSYFEVSEDRKNILIYTYHFSGVVVCYKCNTNVPVPGYLSARIKGSNKPQKNGREVRVRYEIFEEKNGIKDFEAKIQSKNVHNGLVLIEDRVRVNLPAKVDNDSKMIIKLDVTGGESHLWQCKKRSSGEEMFPLEREVFIKELVTCSVHTNPFYIDFVMCGTPESTEEPLQPFECTIDVYEKDADVTEGAAAISSPNISYVTLNDQLGTETAWGSMGEMLPANPDRDEKLWRMANNPEHVACVTQECKTRSHPIAQPHTNSFEIRGNNRSMTELKDKNYAIGIQEVGSRQASHHSDVSEFTDGPQAMAELDLNQTERRPPCENSDQDEYPAKPYQDQTVPKDH